MGIQTTRDALSRIFYQRCFWLFIVLIALIGAVSFVPANDHGRLVPRPPQGRPRHDRGGNEGHRATDQGVLPSRERNARVG